MNTKIVTRPSLRQVGINRNKFIEEEVFSTYGYTMYSGPKSITKQCAILRKSFPDIGFADEKRAKCTLPADAEGWFAQPKWQTIGSTYEEACIRLFNAIKETRKGKKFLNNLRDKTGPGYLRQRVETQKMFQAISDEQNEHSVLVVASQFGLRHKRSPRRALEVMEGDESECALDVFAVGCMILTHPARFTCGGDLYVHCTGSEYAPSGDSNFSHVPTYSLVDGALTLDFRRNDDCDVGCGTASAFRME